MRKIMIIDTSIMCVWLRVPGKETAGKNNEWNYNNVSEHIDQEINNGTKLCLPMTSVIETGNHIAHVRGDKTSSADNLRDVIIRAANGKTPWIVFDQQNEMWKVDRLTQLAKNWNEQVKKTEHALGDAIIVEIAKTYAPNFEIEIFTGDGFLKDFERKIQGQNNRNKLRRNRNR